MHQPPNAILCPALIQERIDELVRITSTDPGNRRAAQLLPLYGVLQDNVEQLRARWQKVGRLATRALRLLERGDPMGYMTCVPHAADIERVGERVSCTYGLIELIERDPA